MPKRCHDERGATAVLIAFSAVGLLAFGGLVMDGGNQFSQRREMQNAADSSATAGANALYLYKVEGAPRQDIYLDALDNAVENGAIADEFSCDLVQLDAQGAEIGTTPCPESSSDPVPNDAWKVRVTVESRTDTHLMRVVGIDSFTSNAGAAASLLAATVANSPFMLCAAPGTAHDPPLLVVDLSDPTGWDINPAAVGATYDVWGNAIKDSDCGLGEDFRGLVDNDGPGSSTATFTIPGDWPADHGNKAGHTVEASLIGGCGVVDNEQIKDIPVGCEFAVPLCPHLGVTTNTLHCVKVGRFKVTKNENGTPDLEAEFLGGGLAVGGAGAGVPTEGDIMIIKLSE
ncbi:MAG: pilus assembly protein TadG-related protein [Microthrixaceae bacterium]